MRIRATELNPFFEAGLVCHGTDLAIFFFLENCLLSDLMRDLIIEDKFQ